MKVPIEERLERRHIKTPGGCWRWVGWLDRDGYGQIKYNGITRFAHRMMVEVTRGVDLTGLTVDHLCRNRACVNPLHLDVVTNAVNLQRQWARYAEPGEPYLARFCRNQHEYTEANTRRSQGRRVCIACNQASVRRYARKQREARLAERQAS